MSCVHSWSSSERSRAIELGDGRAHADLRTRVVQVPRGLPAKDQESWDVQLPAVWATSCGVVQGVMGMSSCLRKAPRVLWRASWGRIMGLR
eukprot:4608072-Pyramimonas_sp.AAC.1